MVQSRGGARPHTTRTIARATDPRSATRTRSSTACERSMPRGPAITHGIPRSHHRRMSAPHGTPANRAARPISADTASRTSRANGWSTGVSPDANWPPAQRSSTAPSPAAATAASTPARACAGDSPPPPGALVLRERGVHRHVAVDRRHALETMRGVRGDAVHRPGERQRAGLGADDVEAGRLGDQARIERAVALERGEGPEAAVLLRRHGEQHDFAVWRAAAERGERVQRGDDRALHVDAAASVYEAVLDRARPRAVAPALRAGRHHVDVPVDREPRAVSARARQRHRQPPQLVARRLLARMPRMRAERVEVVAHELGAQAERGGELGQALERRPLLPRDARDAHERRDVARERGGVDAPERRLEGHGPAQGVASSAGRAVTGGSSTAIRALRTAFEIARTYAIPAASRMSVATPWPPADCPRYSTTTETSPSASSPPVSASTRKSRRRASIPVAALIARKIASTGPSPVNEPSRSVPSGESTDTVACGGRRVEASTSNQRSV